MRFTPRDLGGSGGCWPGTDSCAATRGFFACFLATPPLDSSRFVLGLVCFFGRAAMLVAGGWRRRPPSRHALKQIINDGAHFFCFTCAADRSVRLNAHFEIFFATKLEYRVVARHQRTRDHHTHFVFFFPSGARFVFLVLVRKSMCVFCGVSCRAHSSFCELREKIHKLCQLPAPPSTKKNTDGKRFARRGRCCCRCDARGRGCSKRRR